MLNVARYDAFKLAEAVLGGQVQRVQRMLAGLQAEGEAPVLVHWALSEDIRTLHRVRTALDAGPTVADGAAGEPGVGSEGKAHGAGAAFAEPGDFVALAG